MLGQPPLIIERTGVDLTPPVTRAVPTTVACRLPPGVHRPTSDERKAALNVDHRVAYQYRVIRGSTIWLRPTVSGPPRASSRSGGGTLIGRGTAGLGAAETISKRTGQGGTLRTLGGPTMQVRAGTVLSGVAAPPRPITAAGWRPEGGPGTQGAYALHGGQYVLNRYTEGSDPELVSSWGLMPVAGLVGGTFVMGWMRLADLGAAPDAGAPAAVINVAKYDQAQVQCAREAAHDAARRASATALAARSRRATLPTDVTRTVVSKLPAAAELPIIPPEGMPPTTAPELVETGQPAVDQEPAGPWDEMVAVAEGWSTHWRTVAIVAAIASAAVLGAFLLRRRRGNRRRRRNRGRRRRSR